MQIFERGKPYPIQVPEGSRLNFDASGGLLLLGFNRPTSKEVGDVRQGVSQFALVPLRHSVVLAFRLGEQPWSDAGFCIGRLSPDKVDELLTSEAFTSNGVLAVHIHLVDTSNNITKALRVSTLTLHQSTWLAGVLAAQARVPWSPQAEEEELVALYRAYPSDALKTHPDAIL